jgi:cell division septation protein DedD
MADDGFREIQLNGKQLVFLFMAATVVSVVIFLCGVMVGRGVVRGQQVNQPANVAEDVADDPTLVGRTPPTLPTASTGAPLSTQETLTYPERLEEPEPPAETLRELPPTPQPTAGIIPAPERIATTMIPSEPAGSGFVVQVAAVRQRGEADTIARRLSAKGYPAFVTSPPGAPHLFRVRVGKYQDRAEAESIAGRLETEEQFRPWITR